ncbi:MAG: DUF4388 domain-containing protein, partial [Planctomycetota bacterium]
HLYFRDGQVIPLTDIPLEAPGLDQLLVKQKILDPEILEEIAWDRENGIVDAIVRRGIAPEKDLLPFVRQRLEETVYDLFLWDNAYFEFQKDEVPKVYANRLAAYEKVTLVPNSILMEAVRRVDEWGRIKTRIPSLKYIFVPRGSSKATPGDAKDAPLKSAEIWPHLSVGNNLSKVQELIGASKIDVCQTVLGLLRIRAIRALSPTRLESEFGKALNNHDYSTCLEYLEFAQALGLEAIEEQNRMEAALLSDRDFVASPGTHRLAGSLINVNFSSFFLGLFLNHHEGTIRVEDSECKKVLLFSPSEIAILSRGAREQPDFGEILIREGKLSNREMDHALTLAEGDLDRAGQVLLETHVVSEKDMIFAVRKKILDEILDIFLWRNARFEFVKNQVPEEFMNHLHVSRLRVASQEERENVVENLTRFREISGHISPRTIFTRKKKASREGKGVLGSLLSQIGGREEKPEPEKDPLLDLIDGHRRVADLIRLSGGLGIDICERLNHFVDLGEIVPLSETELKEACETAIAEDRYENALRFCEFALEKGLDRDHFSWTLAGLKAEHPDLVEGAREPRLEGDLRSFSLADLFQSLYLNKHSGTLVVTDGVNEKTVYLTEGSICLTSRGGREVSRLGDFLVDAGKVSEADVAWALEAQKASGKRIGEILVQEGLVTDEEINEAVLEKIREELFDIFLWDDAVFTFTKSASPEELLVPESRTTRLELDTTRILMTAVNRIQEWEKIEQKFVTRKAVFHVPRDANPDLESLTRKERAVFRLIDGRNNVDDVIEKSGVGRFNSCRILDRFFEKKWAAPMDLERVVQEAEDAFKSSEFELCVKYYEYATFLDPENTKLTTVLDLVRGNPFRSLTRETIHLKGMDLTKLFSNLIRESGSGTLIAKDAKSERLIYFARDEILVLSIGERKSPSVEETLLARGKLTEKDLVKIRARRKSAESNLASILEKQGIVPFEEADYLLKKKILEDIEDIFRWPEVSIEFKLHHLPPILEDPDQETTGLRTNVWELLDTIIDRITEWNRIRKLVPSEDIVFVAAPQEQLADRVIHPLGDQILAKIDGKTSLREILHSIGGDWFDVYRAMKKLFDAQLIRPITVEEALQAAQLALVFSEHKTARILYQSILAQKPGHTEARWKLESLRHIDTTRRRRTGETAVRYAKLTDVLNGIIARERCGTLTVNSKDGSVALFVGPERILLLPSGSRRGPYLGEMLRECGFATASEIEAALRSQGGTRKRLGEILILQGVVTEENLHYALREKVLADIHDLFERDIVELRFNEGPPRPSLTYPGIPVTDLVGPGHPLLEEALEREPQWKEIRKAVPSPKAIFRLGKAKSQEADESDPENPALALIDGKLPVAKIIGSLRKSGFAGGLDLMRLAQSKSIRLLTAEEAKKAGNRAFSRREYEEAVAFYEWALVRKAGDPAVKRKLEKAEALRNG